MQQKGLVVKNTGSHYRVRTNDGSLYDCCIKGNFRLKGLRSTNPIAVGDCVTFELATDKNGETCGWIVDIDDRRNYIIRRASNLSKQSHILAANVDQCLLVITVSHPETSTTFIDRFLATAEAYRIPIHIVINKADLYSPSEQAIAHMLITLYEGLGYPCHLLSLTNSANKEKDEEWDNAHSLLPLLLGKTTLLSGNSGVGKSTLLNALIPGLNQKTAEISDVHDTGMHTTTFSEMFMLRNIEKTDAGNENENEPDEQRQDETKDAVGWLIDTPGVKGFGTFDMGREEVSHYFRELFHYSKDCRYGNCTHTHEPGCAVLQALDKHLIAASRYASYLSMLEDKEESKYR